MTAAAHTPARAASAPIAAADGGDVTPMLRELLAVARDQSAQLGVNS
jgi:hypothetical protein